MNNPSYGLGRMALSAGLLLMIAACGGDGNATAASPSEQTQTAAAEIGSDSTDPEVTTTHDSRAGAISGDGFEIPENLSIGVLDGGTITGATTDAGFAFVTIEYSIDRYEDIAAFYRSWTGNDSRAWSESDTTYDDQGATVRGTVWRSGGSDVGVTLCRSMGGSGTYDATCVRINQIE